MIEMTEDEYRDNVETYSGICLACKDTTFGGVEGDARKYKCESCDENQVYGTEELLIMGKIDIID